jgi:hypothetical protein
MNPAFSRRKTMGRLIKMNAHSTSTGRHPVDSTSVSHQSMKKMNFGPRNNRARGGAVGLAMNLLGG